MKLKIFTVLLLSFFSGSSVNVFAILPSPDHIVIVMMENHGYNQIIGSSSAPYINSLANDPMGALFTNSHGTAHPSQPNYLMFYSGSNQGVTNDNLPAIFPFTAVNLGAALINGGKTFVGYSEDLPSVGYNGVSYGYYVRKHNPWVNWQGSPSNGYPITVNQPYTSFPTDYTSLPTVSYIVPNLINDMHDGTIQQGDTWLHDNINNFVIWAKTHNSLLILTFDEDNFTVPNQIPTIFVGQYVLAGSYSDYINHYNILRTIEDIYSVPRSGAANTSNPIINCWVVPSISVNVTMFIEGFYNSATDLQVSDTLKAFLANNVTPFNKVDSAKSVVSTGGNATFKFANAPDGTYYLVITHRNSIETWSALPITVSRSLSSSYDFSSAMTKAFGNNMKQVDSSPLRFAIFSGDINQDGLVELADLISIYNDSRIFASGYVRTDVNGDNIVDLTDIVIAYNNSNNFVGKITP